MCKEKKTKGLQTLVIQIIVLLVILDNEEQQNVPPQKMPFSILIILSCRHLKNGKCRERLFLNFPYLPEDRPT